MAASAAPWQVMMCFGSERFSGHQRDGQPSYSLVACSVSTRYLAATPADCCQLSAQKVHLPRQSPCQY